MLMWDIESIWNVHYVVLEAGPGFSYSEWSLTF